MTDLARYRANLTGSDSEAALAFHLKAVGVPFVQQFHFAADWTPPRRFAADFGIEDGTGHVVLLVEVDGGGFIGKGHSKGAQMERDRERDALALIHGYRVLRCTPRQVDNGQVITWIEHLLEMA